MCDYLAMVINGELLMREGAKVFFTNGKATTNCTGVKNRPAAVMLKDPAWLGSPRLGGGEHRKESGLKKRSL